jgi:GNAT superfamily N-acetyltransferase
MRDELSVVPARAEHHGDFARLLGELHVDDPVPSRERWLEDMAAGSFFLESGGRVVAYGYGQVLDGTGYVRHVVVDPSWRGRGLGRRVMDEHARRFRAAGCASWQLNVLRDNAVALALYRSLGMEIDFATAVVRIAPDRVARLPRSTRAIAVRDVEAGEERRIERVFELAPGLLATFRGKSGQRVLALVDAATESVLGVARFDPSFPGCFPFLVAEPSLARALIETLLPSLVGKPWIQLVIERDEALARMLLDAGGTLHHDIVHMSGALPNA